MCEVVFFLEGGGILIYICLMGVGVGGGIVI